MVCDLLFGLELLAAILGNLSSREFLEGLLYLSVWRSPCLEQIQPNE